MKLQNFINQVFDRTIYFSFDRMETYPHIFAYTKKSDDEKK
jgi:hypothetical protein